jgi:hypothetical protein
MREFNFREKKQIRLLTEISFENVELFSHFLQEKYFTKTSNIALFILAQQNSSLLYFKKEIFDDIKKRKQEYGEFLELISLIKYLKENRYITIFDIDKKNDIYVLKQDFLPIPNPDKIQFLNNQNILTIDPGAPVNITNENNDIIYCAHTLDKSINDFILENFTGLAYVSEDLKYFVKNNFKTKEDIRFINTQSATWISIFLATIIGLYSIFRVPDKQSVQIAKNQVDSIINSNKKQKDIQKEILLELRNKNNLKK